jgi:hypothetical protein
MSEPHGAFEASRYEEHVGRANVETNEAAQGTVNTSLNWKLLYAPQKIPVKLRLGPKTRQKLYRVVQQKQSAYRGEERSRDRACRYARGWNYRRPVKMC